MDPRVVISNIVAVAGQSLLTGMESSSVPREATHDPAMSLLAAKLVGPDQATPYAGEPDLDSLRPIVKAVGERIAELNRSAEIPEPVASLLWANCLSGSLPVVILAFYRELEAADLCLGRVWQAAAATLGGVAPGASVALPSLPAIDGKLAKLAAQAAAAWIPTFALALSEVAADLATANKADTIRDELRAHLALTDADVERILGVCGAIQASPEAHAYVASAGAALDRLLRLFRPESLPQVIRRHAALFDGQRALDWILAGRITEVADRYDVALSYQA